MGEPQRRRWSTSREAFADARWRRQVPFGPYHTDLCSRRDRLVVAIDGDDQAGNAKRDAVRTRFLERQGYRVCRFGHADVMRHVEGMLAVIARASKEEGRP